MNLDDCQEFRVFDESDGTEVDDNKCLLEYEKGSVFVLGQEWKVWAMKLEKHSWNMNIKKVVCLGDIDRKSNAKICT